MAKLDKKTRDNLKDSDFGIPSKRMYPIHDKAHVEAAVKLFGHASNEDKPELAYRILKKAKEFGMDSSGWTQVNLWAKKYKGESTNESADDSNEKFEQYEFDIIEELLPSNWKKVVFFALYTEGSWEMKFYVKTQGSDKFVSCYQLSNISKNELMQAFKKLDKIIQKERNKYSEKWTAKGMTIELDGGFKSFYDYEDHSEDGISFLKKWEDKYVNNDSEKEDLTEGITESFSSTKQETLNRIRNKCVKALEKIIRYFEDGTMDIRTFVSIWTSVYDKYQSTGNTSVYVGYRIRDDFISLKHLLKKAIRNHEQFDNNEIRKMESAYDEVKDYIKLCDSCYSFADKAGLPGIHSGKNLIKHEKDVLSSSKKIVSSLESLNPFEKKLNIIDMKGINIPLSEKTISTPIIGKQKTIEKYDESSITEAAASGSASLLTVKNQLMKLVGNAFKFIGGSLVPKFTMQSTEKPAVAFDVNTDGRNVEVTPKYNGVADTLHKKKGIAFMRAAEVIADFADNVVNSFKSATPATESVEYYDEYFEALLEYADELMDECELEAYLDENPEMEFAICIGEDRLYDEEDFDAYFEGTEYDGEDHDIIIESDLFTETAHPYDDYLKRHQYDPKTNTVVVNGVRIDAGAKGSKKQRNRLNKLLRERGYDPETETILSDIPDGNGGFRRIPFNIHVTTTEGDKVVNPDAKKTKAPVRPTDLFDTQARYEQDPEKRIDVFLAEKGLPDFETCIKLGRIYDDIMDRYNRGEPRPSSITVGDDKYSFEELESIVTQSAQLEDELKNAAVKNNPQVIDVNKRYLMRKPVDANATVSHEIGHIANGDLSSEDEAIDSTYKYASDYIDFATDPSALGPKGLIGHGADPTEYRADQYGIEHNPYSKTGVDTLMSYPSDYEKYILPRQLKQQAATIAEMRDKGASEEEIARKQARFDEINQAEENEVYTRMAAAGMYGERQRQKNEEIQRQRRRLLRDQLQQQIDSGQLTPKQISQARKKIARIDQFDRDLDTYTEIDPKTGRPITYKTQAQRQADSKLAKNIADTRRLIDPRTNPDARPDTTTTYYTQARYKRNNSKTGRKAGDIRYDPKTGKPILIQQGDSVVTQPVSAAGKKRYEDRLAQLDRERSELVRNYPQADLGVLDRMSSNKKRRVANAHRDAELRSAMREANDTFDFYRRTGRMPYRQEFDIDSFISDLSGMTNDEIRERLDGINSNIKERQKELAQNPDDKELALYISDCKKCKRAAEKVLRERTGQAASKKTKSSSSSETPKKKRTGTKVIETEVPAEDTKKKPASKKKPEEAPAKSEPKKKEAAPEKKPVEKKPTPAKPASTKKSETKSEETKK